MTAAYRFDRLLAANTKKGWKAMDYNGKRLLIMGANPETAGLVKKANALGIYTVVTDYDPNAYAKRFASKACDVDAMDTEALVALAKEEKVDGVLLGVAEALMPTYEKVCAALGFPCYGNQELFALFVDKANFKNVCRQHDVPVVEEYFLSDDFTDEELSRIPLPVVVKPVDACSSKGISICKTYEELKTGIEKALSFSRSKRLIIEKYMTGAEVVIYYVFQDGVPSFVGMCDRYTNKEQEGVAQLPTSYVFPSRYQKKYSEEVDAKVKKMFQALRVQNGVMFIQSFIDNGEVRFYEPGYRLNGAQEHYIIGAATGIDAKELMLHFALTGRMSDEDISRKAAPTLKGKYGCKLSPLVKEGTIAKIVGLDQIAEMKDVVSVNPSYDEGGVVSGYGTLKQIICRFFIVSEDKVALKNTLDEIQKVFNVYNENGEAMLLREFDTEVIITDYE